MNQEQQKNNYEQESDQWQRIGDLLKSIRHLVNEFLPKARNQAPANDLYYHLDKAVACWGEVGGLKQPEPQELPVVEEVKEEGQKGKRGPKPDIFLSPLNDRNAFILSLRSLILKRFVLKGKNGMMILGREKMNELEPSKYFACLYSSLIDTGVAEEEATPKGFERLIKEAIYGTPLSQTFKLHYTSYNNMINGWMKLCTKECLDRLEGRQRLPICRIRPEDCNGATAQKTRLEWVTLCSFVEDNAREEKLIPPLSRV